LFKEEGYWLEQGWGDVIMGAAVLGSAVAVRGVQKYDAKKASSAAGAGGADDIYANKGYATGEDWNNYFKGKYRSENVQWDTAVNSIDDVLDMPSITTRLNPQQLAEVAEGSGWTVEPLGKGSKAGLPYEQGGGYSMRAPNGGSEYIQYHPGGGHSWRVALL